MNFPDKIKIQGSHALGLRELFDIVKYQDFGGMRKWSLGGHTYNTHLTPSSVCINSNKTFYYAPCSLIQRQSCKKSKPDLELAKEKGNFWSSFFSFGGHIWLCLGLSPGCVQESDPTGCRIEPESGVCKANALLTKLSLHFFSMVV